MSLDICLDRQVICLEIFCVSKPLSQGKNVAVLKKEFTALDSG